MNDNATAPPRSALAGKIAVVVLVLAAFFAGFLLRNKFNSHSSATTQSAPKQLWTCGMHPQVIQDHPGDCPICHMELTPLRLDSSSTPTTGLLPSVTIDPVVVQNMGVRIAPVVLGSIQQEIRAVGYLKEPESLQRDINLRVSGWIEKLYADTEGMAIDKNQPLFQLYSPQIQVALEELIAARRSRDSAGATDEQAKRAAETLYEATAQKLELWGLQNQQVADLAKLDKPPATITFLSPISGHLTEKKVYQGAAVTEGMLVMRLSERYKMWVDAQVYERQLPLVKVGSKVRATVVALPGKVFDGEVAFIHPHLDPSTRTATARIELPNQDHQLRQGMYATVQILADPTPPAPIVPREAVIDTGTRQIAFVSAGAGKFEPRELKLGLEGAGGLVQVLSGLSPGENVITSGQFLLDAESRLKEAIQKHLASNLATTMPAPVSQPLAPRN